jgi:hypothetical protein
MSNIDFYNVSEMYWYPIEFDIVGSEYSVKKTPIVFSNGINFELQECLKECKELVGFIYDVKNHLRNRYSDTNFNFDLFGVKI